VDECCTGPVDDYYYSVRDKEGLRTETPATVLVLHYRNVGANVGAGNLLPRLPCLCLLLGSEGMPRLRQNPIRSHRLPRLQHGDDAVAQVLPSCAPDLFVRNGLSPAD